MKSIKLTAVLVALLAYGSGHAQTADDYAAVAEFLPAEKLSAIQGNEVYFGEYAYLNKHGYHLSFFGSKDISSFPEISEVSALYPGIPPITLAIIENGDLNLMGYNFPLKRESYVYYRIPGSDKFLVIPPTNLSLQNLNSETE